MRSFVVRTRLLFLRSFYTLLKGVRQVPFFLGGFGCFSTASLSF
jgi:hypothetical protein